MRKVIAKVTAMVLVLAMAAGAGPVVTQDSDVAQAKTKLKVTIKVKNKADLEEMDIGQKETIKYKVTATGGTAKERKEAKKVSITVGKKSGDDLEILTLDGNEVTAILDGSSKIVIKSKLKKGGKPVAKVTINVNVTKPEKELDMIFKYPTLYYVVEDGKFPVSVDQGETSDYKGNLFDIKTQGFASKPPLMYFNFTYEAGEDGNTVARVDADTSTLVLTGYGKTDIEASYDDDDAVGDVLTVYVMTPEQYKEAEEKGLIEDVEENEFETEEEDDNGGGGDDDTSNGGKDPDKGVDVEEQVRPA